MIRVGIAGLGFGRIVHLPAFRSDSRFEVVSICGRDPVKSKKVAQEVGMSQSVSTIAELLTQKDLDAIAIALPGPAQAEFLPKCIEAGKHVFCEKPLGIPLVQKKKILEQVRDRKLAHIIDFEFSEVPAWKQAKELIDQGALGKILQVEVSWHVEIWAMRSGEPTWKTSQALGGGTLNSFVSHTFYYLEWLLGPIARLSAGLSSSSPDRAEESVSLHLGFESGVTGTASVSGRSFLGQGHRIAVYGTEGSLVLDNPGKDYISGFELKFGTRKSGKLEVMEESKWNLVTNDGRIQAVGSLVRRFGDWIEAGKPGIPSLREGFRVEYLMECARQSHLLGKWESVSEQEHSK